MRRWVLLLVYLISQAASGAEYIRRFNALGALQLPVYTNPEDLAVAINACNSGDTLELRAGTDRPFTFPHDMTFDLQNKDLTIVSTGFTQRVIAIDTQRDTLTVDGNMQFAHGQRIRFFGDGTSRCADRANYLVDTWDPVSRELQVTRSATATAPIDLTDDFLAIRPLYVYFHAMIQPASDSQDYNQFVSFLNGNRLTLKHLTFTGNAPLAGGPGNSNSNQGNLQFGRLLQLKSQAAEVTLEGVQIMDCTRGGTAATQDTSFGVWVSGCPRLTMRRCFTDNTDYHGCRIENVDDTRLTECTFRNFRQRGLGQEADQETPRFLIDRCYFYCTPDHEGRTGPTTELRTCINFDSRAIVNEVAFRQTIFDLRDVEGPGYSWDFQNNATPAYGLQSCPMMKLQSIQRFEMSDCQVLHDGNKNTHGDPRSPGPQCYSLKFDKTTSPEYHLSGVIDATFRRTVFSGSLIGWPAMHNAHSVTFAGCNIMRDGHFNSSFALEFMDYPIIHIGADESVAPAIASTIDHLWDRSDHPGATINPAIVRYTRNWNNADLGPERRFTLSHTQVNALPGMKRDAWIFHRVGAMAGPRHTDPFVNVQLDSCRFCQPGQHFSWGIDDPKFVIDRCE